MDLSGRPFVHTSRVAAEWENRMAPTFKSVIGVYAHRNMIVNAQNLRIFLYPFLRYRTCREVRFIFLEAGDAEATKKEFIKDLNAARHAAGLERVGSEDASKLRFAFVRDVKAVRELATEILCRTVETKRLNYDAYWSFDTTTEVPIGFVGSQETGFGDTWNLNLQESLDKRSMFEQLWSKVLVDSD